MMESRSWAFHAAIHSLASFQASSLFTPFSSRTPGSTLQGPIASVAAFHCAVNHQCSLNAITTIGRQIVSLDELPILTVAACLLMYLRSRQTRSSQERRSKARAAFALTRRTRVAVA